MSEGPAILIVSASEGNASVMTDFLTDEGYRAEAATTLSAFDTALETQSLDLVLIDADGLPPEVWERCERLQQQGTPFFVISQHGAAADEKGRAHDARRAFEKPVGQAALANTIRQLLEET
jgi:DNA-binding response OmpR family regulator